MDIENYHQIKSDVRTYLMVRPNPILPELLTDIVRLYKHKDIDVRATMLRMLLDYEIEFVHPTNKVRLRLRR